MKQPETGIIRTSSQVDSNLTRGIELTLRDAATVLVQMNILTLLQLPLFPVFARLEHHWKKEQQVTSMTKLSFLGNSNSSPLQNEIRRVFLFSFLRLSCCSRHGFLYIKEKTSTCRPIKHGMENVCKMISFWRVEQESYHCSSRLVSELNIRAWALPVV